MEIIKGKGLPQGTLRPHTASDPCISWASLPLPLPHITLHYSWTVPGSLLPQGLCTTLHPDSPMLSPAFCSGHCSNVSFSLRLFLTTLSTTASPHHTPFPTPLLFPWHLLPSTLLISMIALPASAVLSVSPALKRCRTLIPP